MQINLDLQKKNCCFLTLGTTTLFIRVHVIQSESKVLAEQHSLAEK